jgi:exodeoxyribonuclease-3
MRYEIEVIMRVISWNCNRAHAGRENWEYLFGLRPDIVFLQEVTSLPHMANNEYRWLSKVARRQDGGNQTFQTAILARISTIEEVPLRSSVPWVQKEIEYFSGNILSTRLIFTNRSSICAISVHSPAWPLDRKKWVDADETGVKLTQNKDVWVTDLLWAALRETLPSRKEAYIVAGDFNCSETFDAWKGGPRGNKEYLDRMTSIGLTEALRYKRGGLTPTYLNKDGKTTAHQIDHLFVSEELKPLLLECNVGDSNTVFPRKLSDHLPIIADFA